MDDYLKDILDDSSDLLNSLDSPEKKKITEQSDEGSVIQESLNNTVQTSAEPIDMDLNNQIKFTGVRSFRVNIYEQYFQVLFICFNKTKLRKQLLEQALDMFIDKNPSFSFTSDKSVNYCKIRVTMDTTLYLKYFKYCIDNKIRMCDLFNAALDNYFKDNKQKFGNLINF